MSRFVQNNLQEGEEILVKAKFNKIQLMLAFVVGAIFSLIGAFGGSVGIFFIIVGVGLIVYNLLKHFSRELAVTNKRVIGKSGILGLKSFDYPIEKVGNVSVEANVLGRIFHYYTISVSSTDIRSNNIDCICNANEIKNVIISALNQHKEEESIRQAELIAQAMNNATTNKNKK